MDVYEWVGLVWGLAVAASGLLLPLRGTVSGWAYGAWISMAFIAVVCIPWSMDSGSWAMVAVSLGVIVAAAVYTWRFGRARRRAVRERFEKWEAESQARWAEAVAGLQLRDDLDGSMPTVWHDHEHCRTVDGEISPGCPDYDEPRRWAEGGN